MIKNIYNLLGFHPPKNIIYTKEILEEAKKLFAELPMKYLKARPILIEQKIFEEAYAISTAEDSELTEEEAKSFPQKEEDTFSIRDFLMFISEGSSSKAKYEALEYFNIENVEKKMGKVSFSEVSQKLLCDLHYDLCAGLDDFSKELGVAKYHAGTFRRSNSVKVGKFPPYIPPKSKEIPKLLDALFLEFSQKKDISLSDIIEFHFLLYATHPFQNGNKRVCRILESLMIESYGFSAEGTLSLSVYYKKKKSGFHSLLIQSLQRKNPESFVNFALRGYFYAGKHILNNCISIFQETFSRNYTNLLLGILGQEAKDKRYADALRTILELHCSFSHTEFMTKMNEFGYSKGQSQQIIAFLKANEILQQAEKKYFIPGALEINEYALRINKFFLKNGIHTEE